ncbi:MAG: hypothetical protein AB7F08_03570 [Dongiaceae bacterium]
MRPNFLPLLPAAACLGAAACAPQREPDLSTIRTNYDAGAMVEALRGFGMPPAAALAMSSEGEAPGPDDTPDIDNRTVLIRVEAHGAPAQ